MFYNEGADGPFGHVRMRHTVITFWENPVFGKLYLQKRTFKQAQWKSVIRFLLADFISKQ